MRIFSIKLGYLYDSSEDGKAKKYAERAEIVRKAGIELPEDFDKPSYNSYDLLVTGDQLLNLKIAKVEFEVIHEANIHHEPVAMMEAISKALEKVERFFSGTGQLHDQWNSRVTVHMPGQALSMYNKTALLQDACTDGLQDELDNGWRIIACCPQPDQRRPDYILGKFDPDLVAGKGAYRGSDRMPTDVPQSFSPVPVFDAELQAPSPVPTTLPAPSPPVYYCNCGQNWRATPGEWHCSLPDCIPF